ncbi:MAG: YebC/PmpR family DNA-binding transcriptional regulator, partial [Chloroflexi bacterium]|nr:YebC/PmpR family DNA-binding transcriptional regulator [Chloroflexota bacterium]
MSGHSKWATIKRSKAANDAKRGQLFTKLGHEIAVAVREGGPDPEANFALRMVLEKARKANMPKDNIVRAIKRGTGELRDQGEIVEAYYEGYGPHGTAIMVKAVTDNRNRAVSEIRHTFSRHGGNLGSEGCVAWMFSQKGHISIEPGDEDPEEIALMAIDAGAEDVEIGDDLVEVYTDLADYKRVQEALAE